MRKLSQSLWSKEVKFSEIVCCVTKMGMVSTYLDIMQFYPFLVSIKACHLLSPSPTNPLSFNTSSLQPLLSPFLLLFWVSRYIFTDIYKFFVWNSFNLRAIDRVNLLNCLYLASWIPPSARILMPLFLHFHSKDLKFLSDNLYFVHVFFKKIGINHFVYGVVCLYFVHVHLSNIIRSCEMPHWKVYIFLSNEPSSHS